MGKDGKGAKVIQRKSTLRSANSPETITNPHAKNEPQSLPQNLYKKSYIIKP